ncbi:MAG: hypothetical protein KGL39_35290 [Patescibacteria group bacterium]|nr:hypothetical protein [Patescibacteria group bacterium]
MKDGKKKILVYDHGDYLEHAITLGRHGHEVLYYVPWETSFPNSNEMMVGKGMEHITKVSDFWKYVDEVDLIALFCNNNADLVEYLRRKGYKVFGTGASEALELDRWFLKKALRRLNLPTPNSVKIRGLTNLENYLKVMKDKYIKASYIRGDMETHHFEDFEHSQPWFDDLSVKLGPKKEQTEFIVEDPIDGVEAGYDGYTIDGQYPKNCLMGYEYKDKGYVGKIVPYDRIHPALKKVNEKLAPFFRKTKTRALFSTEVRITDKGEGYLIDPCMRGGIPPSDLELELYKNFDEIVIKGAEGILVEPEPAAAYGAQIFFNSDWASEGKWIKVSIPENLRRWVKLMGSCMINGEYYVIPDVLGKYIGTCSVVALGKTPEQCFSSIKKIIEKIDAYQLDKDFDTEKLSEYLKKGEHLGINI